MNAQGRRRSGLALAALLTCLSALTACGSDEPQGERLAFCQGHTDDDPDDGMLDVEFRQGPRWWPRGC